MFHVAPQFQPLMRMLGIDADAIFTHEKILCWRKLPDRENCTLDGEIDGRAIRLHIKRYPPGVTLARDEVDAIDLLSAAQVPAAPLVGWGEIADERSFVITQDLSGYRDTEKLLAAGFPFERLLQPTADLAARLHLAGLHHRDLYLCHFFAKEDDPADIRFIDVARVRRLPRFSQRRWIVKDLAQFWYSTLALPISEEQRLKWLARYCEKTGDSPDALRRRIERKVKSIARHDVKLKRAQPTRNISLAH